jgi:four helix bundle protein
MCNSPRRLKYTDLNVWKKAIQLAVGVGNILSAPGFYRSRGLRDQLERSVSSVPSNIAEGEGQPTNRASIKYYFIARGSLNEVRSQLVEAFARSCISKAKYDELEALAEVTSKLISGVIKVRKAREDNNKK